jgi:adenosylcobinamide-GDP ribazoletransferase
MALVTGALHLDGLADTADALVARDPVAAERARKDPALGVGGVLSLVLVVAAEVAALVSVATSAGGLAAAAVLVGVVGTSRVVPVAAAFASARLARSAEATLGSWFADRVSTADVLAAGLSAVLVASVLATLVGGLVAAGAVGAVILGGLVAGAIGVLRGGFDGDGMGAIVELSVVAGLTTAAVAA